ncbi:1-(5-phosphoribosyl)-5-[(5-phosphoribosylamino)methylideneamino]imidazole-4-carboxamide isomerase [Candidatus Marinamargulisbacteria bacterium SCGC AG-333-B06]|nr:1-(5-phosphoribosyl)-5-[(5-phosphoribosylamino)methylideneamino]imidazole-4-carboxamide isomerase [Candidatus Marinamargulisbacteria bacterium SCGC AG-333-B06]
MFDVIPAIDLLNNHVVRLRQGRYDEVTTYDYSPLELAQRFEEKGATRLHIVDLNGARDGQLVHAELIKNICKHTSLIIEVGGGIRTVDSVHYYLDAGAKHVIIGSLFISNFDLAASIILMFGNHIIAGLDAKDNHIATDGWKYTSDTTLADLINKLNDSDINSLIYTDISKDGMMDGPNIDTLQTVSSLSQKPIIASGGIRNHDDIKSLHAIPNVSGCIVGKALLSNLNALDDFFSIG